MTVENNVMVDLETTATSGNAGVIAIGAAFFDPDTGEIGEKFYETISLESVMDCGKFDVSARCIKWWMTGDDVTQEARNAAFGGQLHIKKALKKFADWIQQYGNHKEVVLWGNGAAFDNPILANAYEKFGMGTPWSYRNDCCLRTLVRMGRRAGINPKKTLERTGTYHNALDDAINQIAYMTVIWQHFFKDAGHSSKSTGLVEDPTSTI